MSFSPAQMFPGAFDPDAAFLDGKFKDSSAPGVYDGSPLSTILFNQEQAFWDAVMTAGGEAYNNSADTPATSQLFKALQQSRQVEPLNNSWSGFFDPKHQEQLPAPAGYPATSGAGGTVYGADDEWSLGNYSSGAANTISADDDGVIFSVGTYKLETFTSEQLAQIDIDEVPVYLVDETGKAHFVNNSTNGVNVTKPDATTLRVELTNAIFATLSITKVWRFFVTESVGRVVELSPGALVNALISSGREPRTLKDVTASRVLGVPVVNSDPCERDVYATVSGATAVDLEVTIGSLKPADFTVFGGSSTQVVTAYARIPAGETYTVSSPDPLDSLVSFIEFSLG